MAAQRTAPVVAPVVRPTQIEIVGLRPVWTLEDFEWSALCDMLECHFESLRPYGNFRRYVYSTVNGGEVRVICCDARGSITSIYLIDEYGNGAELAD